jgi:predicted transposase/invertase (TIGR01784 family)
MKRPGTATVIQNQHDKLFKGIFCQPAHAAELLRTSLPPALLEHVDMPSLELAPGSFVDHKMRERFTDLLYRVTLAGRQAFVYLLLEHKSTADALTAFYIARYVIDILGDYLKNHPRARILPAVVPLVVHHGAGGWSAATSLAGLYDLPSAHEAPGLREALARHLLDLELVVDDVSQQGDDELRRRAMSAIPTLVLILLRKVLTGEALPGELARLADLFARVARAESGVAAMALILRYIMSVAEVSREDLGEILRRQLDPATHEAYMTTAEMIHKEGYDQGLEKGMEEGIVKGRQSTLLRLLQARFGPLPAAVEERVRTAAPEQLDVWTFAVLRAATLDEVFGG